MTKESAAEIIRNLINMAENDKIEFTIAEIRALKKAYVALNVDPTTNADRIRAMTDEELVDFFDRMMETFNPWCDHPCPSGEDSICRSCVVEWLKEEAKG